MPKKKKLTNKEVLEIIETKGLEDAICEGYLNSGEVEDEELDFMLFAIYTALVSLRDYLDDIREIEEANND